jgi:hypothetical protein
MSVRFHYLATAPGPILNRCLRVSFLRVAGTQFAGYAFHLRSCPRRAAVNRRSLSYESVTGGGKAFAENLHGLANQRMFRYLSGSALTMGPDTDRPSEWDGNQRVDVIGAQCSIQPILRSNARPRNSTHELLLWEAIGTFWPPGQNPIYGAAQFSQAALPWRERQLPCLRGMSARGRPSGTRHEPS